MEVPILNVIFCFSSLEHRQRQLSSQGGFARSPSLAEGDANEEDSPEQLVSKLNLH